MKTTPLLSILALLLALFLPACAQAPRSAAPQPVAGNAALPDTSSSGLQVLAVETFLADIAQNVAGERAQVGSLVPAGLDPHAFEPTPRDVSRIAESEVLIVNGAGFEEWLAETLENASAGDQGPLVITASDGLVSRASAERAAQDEHGGLDPHFWLDPLNAVRYVENIRDGLIQADPDGQETYTANAEAYIAQLRELDAWIAGQIEQIPSERRLLVTNHESFGYYADRYGLEIVGTIIPSASTSAAPSAQQLAQLVDHIRSAGVPAIFLETGTNPQLAEQLAQETGVQVVTGLYTHSTDPSGASTYIDMLRSNTQAIVEALQLP